jgi:integrase
MGKQLTEKAIAAAKPKERRYYLREGRGFALQILPSGAKAFVYLYELNKSKGYVLLGHYPDCSLAQARLAYNDAYKLVKSGVDPRFLKSQITTEQIDVEDEAESPMHHYTLQSLLDDGIPDGFVPSTVEQLVAVYYVMYSKQNHGLQTQRNFLYTVKSGIIPTMGSTLITDVRRKDAIDLVEKIAMRAPGQSGNVLKAGRQIFEYALLREWVEIQPFLKITKAVPKASPNVCDRVLDDSEIIIALEAIAKSPSSDSVKRALKMILVTAQRPGEVAQMHSDQISDDWWTIPAKVAKNGKEHRVYLTKTAMSLIVDRKGHIFPSSKGKSGHIAVNTIAQAISRGYLTDEIVKVVGTRKIKARKAPYFGMTPWTPHDLRRTARTNMPRVGVSDEHAEEVLNHTKPGIIGVYNKYRYDNEKKTALLKWEALLLEILAPKQQREQSAFSP